MKPVFAFAAIIVLLMITSCSKSSQDVSMEQSQLQGKWELRVISGFRGVAYPAGSGNTLEFDNNTYTKFEDGDMIQQGTFVVVKDTSVVKSVGLLVNNGSYRSRIKFNSSTEPKVFYQISKDTLYTLQGYFPTDGGYRSVYVRID